MASNTPQVVDIHTHMYPPAYMRILESRDEIPLIRRFAGAKDPRYIILPSEASEDILRDKDTTALPGRPVTLHYSSIAQKIHFMDTHKIDISVISLANPWLDFVAADEAQQTARTVNQDFADMCAQYPGRLYFFATLPLTAPADELLAFVPWVKTLRFCRGVILGTSGLGTGKGLDDPALLPVFEALAEHGLTVFLHPHYGLPSEVWGPRADEYGHVLPLALGFPMETTIAVARMYLAGVFDRVPGLRMLLAHSGGTLPFLAGRIESCIVHDGHLVRQGKVGPERRTIWQVLREQIYLDAVIYSEVGLRAAIDASGADRLLFGTDHPFFPPLTSDEQGPWESMTWNLEAAKKALGDGSTDTAAVLGGNAVRILQLYGEE